MSIKTDAATATRGRTILAAVSLLAPLLAIVVSWLAWRAGLPPTIAFHWDAQDRVDGTVQAEPMLVLTLVGAGIGLAAGIAALAIPGVDPRDRRIYALVAGCLAGTSAGAWLVPAGVTHAAGSAEDASLGGWLVLLVALIGYGVVPYLLTPRAG